MSVYLQTETVCSLRILFSATLLHSQAFFLFKRPNYFYFSNVHIICNTFTRCIFTRRGDTHTQKLNSTNAASIILLIVLNNTNAASIILLNLPLMTPVKNNWPDERHRFPRRNSHITSTQRSLNHGLHIQKLHAVYVSVLLEVNMLPIITQQRFSFKL